MLIRYPRVCTSLENIKYFVALLNADIHVHCRKWSIFSLKSNWNSLLQNNFEINTHIRYSVIQHPLFIVAFDAPSKSPQKASNTSWLKFFQTKVAYFLMSWKIILLDEIGEVLTFEWWAILFLSTPRSCQCVLQSQNLPWLDVDLGKGWFWEVTLTTSLSSWMFLSYVNSSIHANRSVFLKYFAHYC